MVCCRCFTFAKVVWFRCNFQFELWCRYFGILALCFGNFSKNWAIFPIFWLPCLIIYYCKLLFITLVPCVVYAKRWFILGWAKWTSLSLAIFSPSLIFPTKAWVWVEQPTVYPFFVMHANIKVDWSLGEERNVLYYQPLFHLFFSPSPPRLSW